MRFPLTNDELMFKFKQLKFMLSKNATKIDKIFTVDLILCSKCQIDGEYFIKNLQKMN